MDEEEESANKLVTEQMSAGERARLAMYCSTIICMCKLTWQNPEDD